MNAHTPARRPPWCTAHRARPAGWHCRDCGSLLCPVCVATTEVGQSGFESCVHCDGPATVLLIPGRPESYWSLMFHSLRLPVGWRTLLLLVGGWLLVRAVEHAQGPGTWLVLGGIALPVWVVFMAIFQLAAKAPDLLTRQALNPVDELLRPAARLWSFSLGAAALGHAVAYAVPQALAPALLWMLLPLLGFIAPLWVLLAGRGDTLERITSPQAIAELAKNLGGDTLRLGCTSAVLATLATYWWSASRLGTANEILLLPTLLDAFTLYCFFVSARLLGLIAAVRADALGLPFRADLLVPALPNARPMGTRNPRPPPAPKPRRQFVELEDDAAETDR